MDTLLYRVGGLDVHKKFIMACIRITDPDSGKATEQIRRFGSMSGELREMAQWLAEAGVTHVAMESTGSYWKPVWNILEADGRVDLVLVNPRELKQVPGRKSDVKDAQWIAQLFACGLLTASFVPQRQQRELRDLTRLRASLEDEQTRTANRLQKVLEDANIKLASVASDVLGVSGRDMLAALIHGETDVEKMADLARGRLREKIPQLEKALEGHVTEHHQFLLRELLDHLAEVEQRIVKLDARIREGLRPFLSDENVDRLDEIPGVNRRTVENVIAETGTDMSRFPSSGHLASWGGICPGNEESAGRRKRRATTKGNKWLRRALSQSAKAAGRKRESYFKAQYSRLASRRGKNRATLAVAHSLLVVIYHLLKNPKATYEDLGVNWFDQLNPDRLTRHLVKRLEGLGYTVELKAA